MGGQQKNTRARASHLSKHFYDVAAFRGSLAGEGSLFVVLPFAIPLRNTRRGAAAVLHREATRLSWAISRSLQTPRQTFGRSRDDNMVAITAFGATADRKSEGMSEGRGRERRSASTTRG